VLLDVLLGHDSMRSVCCAVCITSWPRSCDLEIGSDRNNIAARISRSIRESYAVSVPRSAAMPVICGMSMNLTRLAMSPQVDNVPDEISSIRQFKVFCKVILQRQVAYRISVTSSPGLGHMLPTVSFIGSIGSREPRDAF
jgi:hypothetical protein